MKDFRGKLAVVTGGGTGMGRELVRALVAEGASVAMCDLSEENMARTMELAEAEATGDARVTAHVANVSAEEQLTSFARDVGKQHGRESINLLINNAGIAGGGSFVSGSREEWERTFSVCWFGVYYGCRAFLPMLMAADEGWIVNTSSINGFWASLGPGRPHTSYSAAKFAVKGFTEALLEDLRLHAPHVGASLVMPGHIGTDIVANTLEQQGTSNIEGFAEGASPEEVAEMMEAVAVRFRDEAPTTATDAARIILDGVRAGRWRILVGDDAEELDREVRASPEDAYQPEFFDRLGLFANF